MVCVKFCPILCGLVGNDRISDALQSGSKEAQSYQPPVPARACRSDSALQGTLERKGGGSDFLKSTHWIDKTSYLELLQIWKWPTRVWQIASRLLLPVKFISIISTAMSHIFCKALLENRDKTWKFLNKKLRGIWIRCMDTKSKNCSRSYINQIIAKERLSSSQSNVSVMDVSPSGK